MREWIKTAETGYKTIHLLQVDLSGHSQWFAHCADITYGPEATEAKKNLAKQISESLGTTQFDLVFWRGDGGMYAAMESTTDGDGVVNAAHLLRRAFLDWQKDENYTKLDLNRLSLRISCHTCQIWIGPEPEFWSSDDLNLFTKYEREFAKAGAIAITRDVHDRITENAMRERFRQCIKEKTVGELVPRKFRIHYDSAASLMEGVSSEVQFTVAWFRRNFSTTSDQQKLVSSERFAIGDAVVLYICPSPDEYLDVELEFEQDTGFDDLECLPAWQSEKARIEQEIKQSDHPRKNLDLTKASPVKLRMPLKDFPVAKISYVPTLYSRARSFFTVLEGDKELWRRLCDRGADYDVGAPRRPGLLVVQMVLLLEQPNAGPCVLLAQRTRRQPHAVGFHLGAWSASLEEQFVVSDVNLETTVRRGLQEELLGKEAPNVTIQPVGLYLERSILNLALAVIVRTTLTLKEIYALWQDCDDRDEHSQIIGLPLTADVLKECIREGKLTERARGKCLVHDRSEWDRTQGWSLHPMSAFRLALALWAKQSEPPKHDLA